MIHHRKIEKFFLSALIFGFFFLTVRIPAWAQNSHFGHLKNTYLSQNPEAAKRKAQHDLAEGNATPQPIYPPGGMPMGAPPNFDPESILPPRTPEQGVYFTPDGTTKPLNMQGQAGLPTPPPIAEGFEPDRGIGGLGMIPDPLATSEDLIYQAGPADSGCLNASLPSTVPPRPAQLGGDPKDPLNAHFIPNTLAPGSVPLTPFHEMIADVRLNDVYFTSPHCGWAVGDRGVIWNTRDGGKQWTLQETPISCPLYSVTFLNESIGIAVGGYHYPFSSQGRGVILTTHDGGVRWSLYEKADFPVLRQIHAIDSVRILLVGESSERYPGGRFLSSDAGQTWKPFDEGKTEGWKSVGFDSEKNGFGVGINGTPQIFRDRVYLSETPDLGKIRPAGVVSVKGAPAGSVNGWMVGEGGLVLSTTDQGFRWSVTPGRLAANTASLVDLNTLAVRGKTLWVAGSPGTSIYRSDDNGVTWSAASTGITAPIHKLVFTDEKTGYAVGDLGTILKTENGGKTWTLQRTGGARLAVLGLFARPEDVPLEAFTQLCADQGFLGGTLLLFRAENKPEHPATLTRFHEAMVRTGANGAWNLGALSLPSRELRTNYRQFLEHLKQVDDGQSLKILRERLVAAIRQWKPEIILTSGMPTGSDPSREFVLREVMEAIKLAGDSTAYPLQLTEQGLTPWQVKKVHYALEDGRFGDVNIAATTPSIRLGQAVDELVFVARGLIDFSGNASPPVLGFATAYDVCAVPGRQDFFAGIDLAPGCDARRTLYGSYADYWDEIELRMRHRSSTRSTIRHLSQETDKSGPSGLATRLASSVNELTRKIDQDAAVQSLLEMAKLRQADGDWDAAREAYEILARNYSAHPMARDAFRWLVQYYSAEEIAWRTHQGSIRRDSQVSFQHDGKRASMVASAARGAAVDRDRVDPRLEQAMALGRHLDEQNPGAAEDPKVRFALASAQRRKGFGHEALKYFRSRGGLKFDDVWGMRARAEVWLSIEDKSSMPPEQQELPLPSIRCSYAATKPRLDGLFEKEDDRAWFKSHLYSFTPEKPRRRLAEMLKPEIQGRRTAGLRRESELAERSKNFGTQIMFMYDKEHLFIGIRCKKVAGFSYPPVVEKARSRDADISDQDRIEILLDLDRDYGTNYNLTFDSRCWVVDSCCGDKTWNPSFSVSRPLNEDDDYWYVEAAIPLESLTDRFPMPGDVWTVALRRIVPGVGVECWNAENSFDLEEGFGFLLFE